MSDSLRQKTVSGVFWSGIERFSVQGIQFLIEIIMARLLTPSDYGVIGMLAIFLAISQSFIDSGFSNALIRKPNRTEVDYSTVFYFNIIVGTFFYFLLFFTSPLIADFYKTPILEPITKVVALNLFINSLVVVQRARLTIAINFKTQAKASLIAVLISGIIGITLAYQGFGVWSLVVQSVCNTGINMILLWIFSKWKPLKTFSYQSFKEMFSYGSKLLLSGLIDTTYKNIYTIVIGKKFAATELGYYTRADQFAQFPSSNVTGVLQRVTFPVLSSIQNDEERLRNVYRKYLRISSYVIFPLMIGLAAVASPFIRLILTDKWEGVILLLQILCIARMWYPVHAINLNLLQVKGRSDLFLKLEVLKKLVGVTILCITVPMGITMMCVGSAFSSVIALVINTYYTGKLIRVSFFMQMKDLSPTLAYSLSMGLFIYLTINFINSNLLQLIVGIFIGVLYYLTISYLTHSRELRELLSLVRR